MNLIQKTMAIALCGVVALTTSCTNDLTLISPNKSLVLSFENNEGVMSYELKQGATQVVQSSEISIFGDSKVSIVDVDRDSERSSWKPTWGQFSEIECNYNELEFTLAIASESGESREATLIARLFDDGVGFRYILEDYSEAEGAALYMEFNTMPGDEFYWTAGEQEPVGPITQQTIVETNKRIIGPLIVEAASGLHLALLESDLLMTPGFQKMNYAYDKVTGAISSTNKVAEFEGDDLVSPWRVILVGEGAGDLVISTTTLNLATECVVEDTSWIKPGKTLWDWRVHSYVAPDGFTYGIDTESYKRFIDFAKESGMDYFLIDDAWYTKVTPGHFELSEKLDLAEVIRYAKEKDVDLLLYYDRRHGHYGDDELFPYYSEDLGMKGMKYGFMSSNVSFTRDAIRMSAENKLLIDFHDGPLPATGAERTYPNAVAREYCHAQLDSRRAFTPEGFIKTALVNAVQGPLDMNNGYLDIAKINAGARQKGPSKLYTYFTTVASEAARTLIINTGLLCLPDAPEVYKEKSDIFEFMLKLPIGRWDESRILHAKMGEYITTARRHGTEWYIGSVMDQNGGELTIECDFLEKGKEYLATLYMDGEDADCRTNPESYRVETISLKQGDNVVAKIAKGGGHAMWIREK